uniref:CSON000899 protein n=1 Tax=Culicoides sonorensis TaxID=179676 RepID=A0A336LTG8_CULSO
MKQMLFNVLLLCALWKNSMAIPLIVPEELPSILSLVYSNIPPIKKGTDSRVGFGFRLGEHADFQILYEIGPQTNTKPIGETSNDRRRYADVKKPVKDVVLKDKVKKEASWMEKWSQQKNKTHNDKTDKKTTVEHITVHPSAIMQLYQLYGSNYTLENVSEKNTLPKEAKKDLEKITSDLSDIEFE